MSRTASVIVPNSERLQAGFPTDGGVSMELVDGVPVLRASAAVQARIEALLDRQRDGSLSDAERDELEAYEILDDHLALVNRLARSRCA